MDEAGIRQLKMRASAMVRRVRERKAKYLITYRGRPVAVLGPLEALSVPEESGSDPAAWQELERLGAAIGKGWKSPKTSGQLLSEGRR